MAYAFGHAAAGRIHGVPFAPFEAFHSLGGYGPSAVNASKAFWGRVGGDRGGRRDRARMGQRRGSRPRTQRLDEVTGAGAREDNPMSSIVVCLQGCQDRH